MNIQQPSWRCPSRCSHSRTPSAPEGRPAAPAKLWRWYVYMYIYIYIYMCILTGLVWSSNSNSNSNRNSSQNIIRKSTDIQQSLRSLRTRIYIYSNAHATNIFIWATSRHGPSSWKSVAAAWLRTNGVNTNGAAAKVMIFDRFGKKLRPGTFGNIQVG